MAKVAKKLFFDIPGIGRVNALPGATFDLGGEKRDSVIGDAGVVGYTEEPMPPSVQCKLANTADVSIETLKDLTDVNINIQDDNGKSWVMRESWTVEPPKLSGGEIDLQMAGIETVPVA